MSETTKYLLPESAIPTQWVNLAADLPPGVDGQHQRTVPAGSTVADLLDAIGIPANTDVTVGLDGELADRTDPLHDGADVMLLSPMEGG